MSQERALEVQAQDMAYLDALRAGETELPEGRRSAAQRQIHSKNVERLS
jgi:hypothetical protein